MIYICGFQTTTTTGIILAYFNAPAAASVDLLQIRWNHMDMISCKCGFDNCGAEWTEVSQDPLLTAR